MKRTDNDLFQGGVVKAIANPDSFVLGRRRFLGLAFKATAAGIFVPRIIIPSARASIAIVSRTIGGTPEKKLSLTPGQWARTLDIGNSWTQLRIGVRLAFQPNGSTSNLTTPELAIGVCHGTTNIWGDTNADNAFGVRTATDNWTYNAGSGNPYYNTVSYFVAKKIGSTKTTGSQITNTMYWSAKPDVYRNIIIVQITKGTSPATTWTADLVAPGFQTGAQTDKADSSDIDAALDDAALSNMTTTLGSSGYYTNGSPQTLTGIDEGANGNMDSIFISWSHTSVGCEVSDIKFYKVS